MNTPDQKTDSIPGPVLILIRGLPGSGKTYLANALRDTLGESNVVLLDPDAIDMTSKEYTDLCDSLRAEGIEEKFFPNRFLKVKANEGVRAHKILIWNQPFTDPGGFERTIDSVRTFAAEQHIPLPILLVEVEVSHDIAQQRIKERIEQGGHGPSAGRFARFISDYVSFADKGYQTIAVHGEDEISISVHTVEEALRSLTS